MKLTEEARAGFDRFCAVERISLTAFLEALGLSLGDDQDVIPSHIVEQAAAIDRARKSRR